MYVVWLGSLAILLVSLSGCGPGGPKLVEVTGKVTLDGKPVPKATVIFTPVAPGGSPSLRKTDLQGNFRLEYSQDRSGALVGEHQVEITTRKIPKNELPDTGEGVAVEFVELPKKYGQRGNLTAEVKNQSNAINFELDSK